MTRVIMSVLALTIPSDSLFIIRRISNVYKLSLKQETQDNYVLDMRVEFCVQFRWYQIICSSVTYLNQMMSVMRTALSN